MARLTFLILLATSCFFVYGEALATTWAGSLQTMLNLEVKDSGGVSGYQSVSLEGQDGNKEKAILMFQVFVTGNEENKEKMIQAVKSAPRDALEFKGNTVLGVSALYILDLASAMNESRRGVIENIIAIDYSNEVKTFFRLLNDIICEEPDRSRARIKIRNMIETKARLFVGMPSQIQKWKKEHLERFDNDIATKVSFLSKKSRYRFIRSIFLGGRFAFKTLDLSDSESVLTLSKRLEEMGISLAGLYVSNVATHVKHLKGNNGLEEYHQSVEYLSGLLDGYLVWGERKESAEPWKNPVFQHFKPELPSELFEPGVKTNSCNPCIIL